MIRCLLFDLDNTLYPSSNPMEQHILRRMSEFAASFLKLPVEEAQELRRKEMPKYGTTLEWLIAEYGFKDTEGYLAAVHPQGEEECIEPDPALGDFLRSLKYTKAIYTNSPREHAERVLNRLGFPELFDQIFDIRFNRLQGKPHASAGLRVCAALGLKPSEAVLIDDVPRYVRGFMECGGYGVLMDDRNRHGNTDTPRISSLYELPKVLESNGRRPLAGENP